MASSSRSLKPSRSMTGVDRVFIVSKAAGVIFCLGQGEVLLAGWLAAVVVRCCSETVGGSRAPRVSTYVDTHGCRAGLLSAKPSAQRSNPTWTSKFVVTCQGSPPI